MPLNSRTSPLALALLSSLLGLLAHARAPPHRMSLVDVAALRVELADASDFAISAAPSAGLADGDWVAVRFSISAPAPTDLVLVYAPLPANLSSAAPVEWFVAAAADPAYLSTGTGVLPARLVNMRAPYTFLLASGSPSAPVVRAASSAVTFANANEPRGARLAVTGTPTEMRVSWSSASAAHGPTVELSGPPAPAAVVVPASSSITWGPEDLCGPPATTVGFHDPGFVHSAVLAGLVPGEVYSYTVGDATGRSQHYSFRVPSPAVFPFGISVVGDMGSDSLDHSSVQRAFPPAPNSTRLMAADVASGLSQAVLHVGDLSYAMGQEASWDYFIDVIATANVISPRVPYMVNQGNHEADYPSSWPAGQPSWVNGSDSGGECGVPTANLFAMPGALGNASRLWWSAAIGPIFTVHFSSELDSTPGGEMHSFVREALAGVDRAVTPWVIVGTHRPLAISSTNDAPDGGDTTVAATLRNNMAPLFADAGGAPVDLVLAGHHHSYQRLAGLSGFGPAPGGAGNLTIAVPCPPGPAPVYKGGVAPVYMDIGTGGAGYSTNIITPQPAWACVVQLWHGFARVTVHNSSALHWQFVDDATGEVADEAWIVK